MADPINTTPKEESLASLLPVSPKLFGNQKIVAVDGRSLHTFMEVGKVFAAWMPEQIEAFGFLEHQDFEVISESGNNPQGGRPSKEYMLSLSMAKELAMVQRTAKGKQARLYFIECENRANDPVQRLMTMTRADMLDMAAGLAREKEALRIQTEQQQATISVMAPKAEFHDQVSESKDDLSISEAAKLLGTGQRRLFTLLRQEKVLTDWNIPYQRYIEAGYFTTRGKVIHMGSAGEVLHSQPFVTGKGLIWLQQRWFPAKTEATQ